MEYKHISVLLDESIENLNINEKGIYVDGTLGGAGHSAEICKRLNNMGTLIGIDQDDYAIKVSADRLEDFNCKKHLVKNNFSNIKDVLDDLKILKVDGVLLDLGVSSFQLDMGERGFSYMKDAPLDMRMNKDNYLTAYRIANEYSEDDLYRIIKEYGEEKWAKRIAKFIVEKRKERPISTTLELVEVIKNAIPLKVRREGGHPAKRTFQALRIAVNNELNIIEDTVIDIVERLNTGGRICIITFHSLEDRIVKKIFKQLQNPCTCPSSFPQCICGKKSKLKIITRKPIIPSEKEINFNSRSKSAKLRVAERI